MSEEEMDISRVRLLWRRFYAAYERLLEALMGKGVKRNIFHPQWLARAALGRALSRAAPEVRGRLLDIGSGSAPYAQFFEGKITTFIALDIKPPACPAREERPSCPFVLGDGLHLPFKNASFDSELATQVLEHTEEPSAALAEANRVLKPGGVLLVSVPFSYPIHDRRDYYRFAPQGITYLLEKAGFKVKEVIPQGSYWTGAGTHFNIYLFWRVLAKNRPLVLLRILLTPLLLLFFAAVNLFSLLADAILPFEEESSNFLLIARKEG